MGAEHAREVRDIPANRGPSEAARVGGKAAFFLFMYLEVLDASFSFDGVIGAFAITYDPIIIAVGLGVGAIFLSLLTCSRRCDFSSSSWMLCFRPRTFDSVTAAASTSILMQYDSHLK